MEFLLTDVRFSDRAPKSSLQSIEDLEGYNYADAAKEAEQQPTRKGLVAIVFGKMKDDGDICLLVYGFRPILYYDVVTPDSHGTLEELQARLGVIRCQHLVNDSLKKIARACETVVGGDFGICGELVTRYDGGDLHLDEEGERVPRVYMEVKFATVQSYNRARYYKPTDLHNVDYTLRPHHTSPVIESAFFTSCNVWPSQWMRATNYTRRPYNRCSHCTEEIECTIDKLEHIDRDDFPKLIISTLDIECISEADEFPLADVDADQVVSVAISTWYLGQPLPEPSQRWAGIINGCSPVEAATIYSAMDEYDLFLATRDELIRRKSDIVVTWNGNGFDWVYMYDRAASKKRNWTDFFYLSKLKFQSCRFENKKMASGARGDQTLKYFSMPGRCNFDAMQWYMQNYKRATYSLESVCSEHTGEHKVDLSYRLIKPYFRGTPDQRRELVVYNIGDVDIMRKLLDALGAWGDQLEQSRVSRVIMERLSTHGQTIKVVSQLNAKCQTMGTDYPFLMNNHNQKWKDVDTDAIIDDGYEGATVVEPVTGIYGDGEFKPGVIVNDFSSLYPSIMIAHNLCSSTNIRRECDREKPGVECHDTGGGALAYFSTKNKGLLPALLEDTLARRKIAKKEKERLEQARERLKNAPEDDVELQGFGGTWRLSQLIDVMDKRQLALKISANSVYGFTGANNGYGDKQVASATTAKGREMLQESIDTANEESTTLKRKDGEPVGTFMLVYGDTDSLMFTLSNCFTPRDCADAGIHIGKKVTIKFHARGHFAKKLEFEKVFKPYILFKKKKYTGIKFEENGDGSMRCKGASHSGTANKRRDSCTFVHKIYDAMVEPILFHLDREASMRAFHEWMQRLVNGKVLYEDLIVTKSLKSSYKTQCLQFKQVSTKPRGSIDMTSSSETGIKRLQAAFQRGQVGFERSEFAKFQIADMRTNSVLQISMNGSTVYMVPAETANLSQLKVVEKQEARERGSGAKSGNRMGMIFVRAPSGQKGGKINDQAEDATYVIEKKLPIDAVYYVVNQCKTPCESLLQHMHPDPKQLIEFYRKEAVRIQSGISRLDGFLIKKRKVDDDEGGQASTSTEATTHPVPPSASTHSAPSHPPAAKRKVAGNINRWLKKSAESS